MSIMPECQNTEKKTPKNKQFLISQWLTLQSNFPLGTILSLGMREWLLWWSQIRGYWDCLTRGDKAWNSHTNSMCLCQMESSQTPLRWDNFPAVTISFCQLTSRDFAVFVSWKLDWPSLATLRFRFVTDICSTNAVFYITGCSDALQFGVNVYLCHAGFAIGVSCQLQ